MHSDSLPPHGRARKGGADGRPPLPGSNRTEYLGPAGSAGPRYLTLGCLRLRLRGDDDLAGDDVRLDLVDLGLQLGRDLAVELVERRQPGAVVLQGPDVRGVVEGVVDRGLDRVLHGHVHALVHTAEQHAAVLGGADAAVGVDPDPVHLATAGLGRLQRTQTGRTGHREDDVRALRDQVLAGVLALGLVLEVAGEQTG